MYQKHDLRLIFRPTIPLKFAAPPHSADLWALTDTIAGRLTQGGSLTCSAHEIPPMLIQWHGERVTWESPVGGKPHWNPATIPGLQSVCWSTPSSGKAVLTWQKRPRIAGLAGNRVGKDHPYIHRRGIIPALRGH